MALPSAGGWNRYGTRRKLLAEGIPFAPRRAWLINAAKAREYDLLIGMDDYNMADIRRLVFPEDAGKIRKLLPFAGSERDIADPWYVSPISTTCFRVGQIPVVGWFVFLPVGLVGCGLEIAVVNPVRDTLMLPIDVFQPYHGYYVRVIDESGFPVAGADVEIDGIGPSEMFWSDSGDKGMTGKDGMVYFPHLNYLPSQIEVNADGYHKRRGDMFQVGGEDRDTCPDRAKGPSWSTDVEGWRVYTVRIFRRNRPTALCRSLEPCVEGIDWKHKVSK